MNHNSQRRHSKLGRREEAESLLCLAKGSSMELNLLRPFSQMSLSFYVDIYWWHLMPIHLRQALDHGVGYGAGAYAPIGLRKNLTGS
ncbi:hypothetical protein VNO80_10525 [Phaseolus coccineus]|uniref:Uncharacterized protein n=1 Tax=Phaseolus coccineus TaxID=3886 RepID=A0AAN9NDL9_PHACN